MADYKLLINGELVNSSLGKTVQDIGPATGEPIAEATRMVTATQTIYHDAKRPSALRLRRLK